jgi:hypothetical protein|tara:strand:- start:451 stop:681 length:231 start_codon:yes stop_codon:yes gene_type:complete
MWAYALIVILASGQDAPVLTYKFLEQCRYQAQELTRGYNNYSPAKSAECTPTVVGKDDELIDLEWNKAILDLATEK